MKSGRMWGAVAAVAVAVGVMVSGLWAGAAGGGSAAKFDTSYREWRQHYKQVLYGTSRSDRRATMRELILMNRAWETLLMYGYSEPPAPYAADAQWQQDLATMTGYQRIAHMQLLTAKEAESHATLEKVQQMWVEIHTRNRTAGFADELVRYHEVMAPVVQAASAGAAAPGLEKQVSTLAAAWQKVVASPRPQVAEADRKKLDDLMAKETAAVGQLQAATKAKSADVPKAAAAVKDAFAEVYLLAG